MTTQEEVQRFLGSQICVKIVSNETLLGQIEGVFVQIGCNYVVSGLSNTYFEVDLSRVQVKHDYWMIDLGYNPTNKAEN